MKHLFFKLTALSLATGALSACGNLSEISDKGTTNNPIFPNVSESSFSQDGNQIGVWANWDNISLIEQGMNKKQISYLIGKPHFNEGFFNVKEWDYVFNYRENGTHKLCQFKVIFDKNNVAQQFYWLPNGCNGKSEFTLKSNLLFEFDKSNLSQKGIEELKKVAHKLSVVKNASITIDGYTDRIGSDAYNLKLSKQRAESVAQQLNEFGINTQFNINGYGKLNQIKDCAGNNAETKVCLSPNRRVEIHATTQL